MENTSSSISAEYICNIMNEAWKMDPSAIRAMLCYQMPVKDTFVNHPSIQVNSFPNTNPLEYCLTFLGLINGFIAKSGLVLCTKWSDKSDDLGACEFLGFDLVTLESCYPQESKEE